MTDVYRALVELDGDKSGPASLSNDVSLVRRATTAPPAQGERHVNQEERLKVSFVRAIAWRLPGSVPEGSGLTVARISGFVVRIVLENCPVVEVEATDDADEGARARFAYAWTLPEKQAHLVEFPRNLRREAHLLAWPRVRVSARVIRYPYTRNFNWTGTGALPKPQLDARAWAVDGVKVASLSFEPDACGCRPGCDSCS